MRGGSHSIDMNEYQVTDKGIVIGKPLRGYRGLITGIPVPLNAGSPQTQEQLNE